MGQYWELVNIDRWAFLAPSGGFKLIDQVLNRDAEPLVSMLRRHRWIEFKASTESISVSKSASSSPLIALPQEIIDLVVAELMEDSLDDTAAHKQAATNLALSCSYFLRILAPRLQERIASGPWAGHRLIFVGDYAEGYPSNIASEAEQKKWAINPDDVKWNPLYLEDDDEYAEGKEVGKVEGEVDFDPVNLLSPLDIVNENDKRRYDMLIALLTRSQELDGSLSQPVLRNITAMKYVRDQALADLAPGFSLGDIIIALALWTNDPSGIYGLGLEGEWAGHRFDIATMADVEGWEDASKLAIEKLLEIDDGDMGTGGRRV